jgi:hypothetical protein
MPTTIHAFEQRTIFAEISRSNLINEIQGRSFFTSGAKARDFIKLFGTAEAVPLRKTIYEIASRNI